MFSYTPLRIVNLVYNKTDIPLQLEEKNISLHILLLSWNICYKYLTEEALSMCQTI